MWWKKRINAESVDVAQLRDAVATLARRADDAESALRRLQVEWSDTLDRVTRMAGRIAKRAERAQLRQDDESDEAAPVNGVLPLSPSAADAMRQVEKRRSRGGWPGGGR